MPMILSASLLRTLIILRVKVISVGCTTRWVLLPVQQTVNLYTIWNLSGLRKDMMDYWSLLGSNGILAK